MDALDLAQFGGVPLMRANKGDEVAWSFGWVDWPEHVAQILSSLPFPLCEQAAPHLAGTGAGKTVLLSDAAKMVTGKHLPAQNQPRGTCVSRGFSRAVDYLQCVEIALLGEAEEMRLASHAYIYGCCREIGNNLNMQDGAVGAWAAKAVITTGVCTNEECADRDAGYDDLAVQWGAKGVPAKFKEMGRKHLVKTTTLVSTPEQARDLLTNGYPIPVCSHQGFAPARDANGVCQPQGTWEHCMMWSGYRDDRKQFLVEQSWGQNNPSGPRGDLDIPDNAFWIDWSVAAKMLAVRDSFALSKFDGYPTQDLPWAWA